jgi:hypothetical protein
MIEAHGREAVASSYATPPGKPCSAIKQQTNNKQS